MVVINCVVVTVEYGVVYVVFVISVIGTVVRRVLCDGAPEVTSVETDVVPGSVVMIRVEAGTVVVSRVGKTVV